MMLYRSKEAIEPEAFQTYYQDGQLYVLANGVKCGFHGVPTFPFATCLENVSDGLAQCCTLEDLAAIPPPLCIHRAHYGKQCSVAYICPTADMPFEDFRKSVEALPWQDHPLSMSRQDWSAELENVDDRFLSLLAGYITQWLKSGVAGCTDQAVVSLILLGMCNKLVEPDSHSEELLLSWEDLLDTLQSDHRSVSLIEQILTAGQANDKSANDSYLAYLLLLDVKAHGSSQHALRQLGYVVNDNKVLSFAGNRFVYTTDSAMLDMLALALCDYVQLELIDRFRFHWVRFPSAASAMQSPNAFRREKLICLIQGAGNVRPGLWSCNVALDEGVEQGSMLPYVKACKDFGIGLVLANPNEDRRGRDLHIDEILSWVCGNYANSCVSIVCHSAGVVGALNTLLRHQELFVNKVEHLYLCDPAGLDWEGLRDQLPGPLSSRCTVLLSASEDSLRGSDAHNVSERERGLPNRFCDNIIRSLRSIK